MIFIKNDDSDHQNIQPVFCSEFYADQIESGDEFFIGEFNNTNLLCPNTPEFNLNADGGSFSMHVISCAKAVEIDAKEGWKSYAGDVGC